MRTYGQVKRELVVLLMPTAGNDILRLKGCVVPILSLLMAGAVQGSEIMPFTAEGTVSTEVFQNLGPTPTSRTEDGFVFCYSNGWWRVEMKFKGGFLPRVSAESLHGNVVVCERAPDGVRIVTYRTPVLNTNVSLLADVEPQKFPPPGRNSLLLSWLTLCPEPKLPILSDKTMQRFVSSEFLQNPENKGDYGLKYCPGGIFISELLITNNGIIQVGTHATRRELPPFDQGYFEFEYKVVETTNWGGLSVPLRSVLRKYIPRKGGGSRDDLGAAVVGNLTIDSLRTGVDLTTEIDSVRIFQVDSEGMYKLSKSLP